MMKKKELRLEIEKLNRKGLSDKAIKDSLKNAWNKGYNEGIKQGIKQVKRVSSKAAASIIKDIIGGKKE